MKTSVFFATVIVECLLSTAIFADISPTQFVGSGIAPGNAPGIRMVSAKVDIDWGLPCTLSAAFVMENTTPNAVDVRLGFPINLPDKFSKKDVLDFSMSFDDIPAKPSDITEIGKPRINVPSDTTWYRCEHTFPPGQTKVTVKTKLPASLVYSMPYHESLEYCIETGASWEGTIGSEEVTIRFPGTVTSDQITSATPAGCTVEGNTVHWEFKDFKPKGNDHDIRLEYLRPDVVAVLAHLRKEYANDPTNPKWIIQLAKHLFALGHFFEGTIAAPFDEVNKTDFEAILSAISDPNDRAFMASIYTAVDMGWGIDFSEKESAKSGQDEFRAMDVLSKTDASAFYHEGPYMDEARDLLEGLLKTQPKNAEAWNVYLANFYRFEFAGVAPTDSVGCYFPVQTHLIEQAYKNCPDDPCIQLWYKRSMEGQVTSFETWNQRSSQAPSAQQKDDLSEQLKKRGIFDVDYQQIKYDYY